MTDHPRRRYGNVRRPVDAHLIDGGTRVTVDGKDVTADVWLADEPNGRATVLERDVQGHAIVDMNTREAASTILRGDVILHRTPWTDDRRREHRHLMSTMEWKP